jgi:hypothetical protein
MEGLKSFHAHVKGLYERARELTSANLSLVTLFASEANRLRQEDEASCLRTLCFSIRRQLNWEKSSESGASCGYSQANLIASLVRLVAGGIIKTVSTNEQLSAFADYLLKSPTNKERPFGLILIYIGSKGLPDDAGVVSISRLARESNRDESEVIQAMREHGYLLISEKTFSLLIDRLVADVREGRLRLPISTEKLSEIMASANQPLKLKSQDS